MILKNPACYVTSYGMNFITNDLKEQTRFYTYIGTPTDLINIDSKAIWKYAYRAKNIHRTRSKCSLLVQHVNKFVRRVLCARNRAS